MRDRFRAFGRWALILFVSWHAFAVMIESMPRAAVDPLSAWIRLDVLPLVRPYVSITSQWQQWSLFSPDPAAQYTIYSIEAQENKLWREIERLEPQAFSTWRRATRMKLLRTMFETTLDKENHRAERLLQLACATYDFEEGKSIRIVFIRHDILKKEIIQREIGYATQCSSVL